MPSFLILKHFQLHQPTISFSHLAFYTHDKFWPKHLSFKTFLLHLSQNIWESHLWLLCLCSLSKYIRESRSRFLEYSSSISDSLLKNSCKSAKNRTLPSVLLSKLFSWSTRICRTSGKDSVKQIPLHLKVKTRKSPTNLSRRSTMLNGK